MVSATRPSEQAVNNAQMVEENVENKDDSFSRLRTRRAVTKESSSAADTLLNGDKKKTTVAVKSDGFDLVKELKDLETEYKGLLTRLRSCCGVFFCFVFLVIVHPSQLL